ncbi:MAG: signal peptidase I [Candidatus Saccharimonadales bacterium]
MQQEPSIPAESMNQNPDIKDAGMRSGKSNGGGWKSALSTIAILVAAPIVALILITFVFQSYEVDGPSMESTLQNHDRLIVWKVPRTIARITNHSYVPHRDDVIVFIKRGLYESGGSQEKQLIKRVIGLPGDRVVVSEGKVTLYNKQHPNGYNPDIDHAFTDNIAAITNGDVDLVVPEGQIFVCGDNRPNSLDSRAFGTVPVNDIVGKLTIRIFPVNTFKSFI